MKIKVKGEKECSYKEIENDLQWRKEKKDKEKQTKEEELKKENKGLIEGTKKKD